MKPSISGLYGITPETEATTTLLQQVALALAGGMRWLQYRSKNPDRGLRQRQARALRELCAMHEARLLVNDDVALALEIGADGVHLGRDDMPPGEARLILGAERLVGVSCYNQLELAVRGAAEGADYVAFGSFFPSTVKPGAVRADKELISAAKRRLGLPVVAIGGITTDNAPGLIEAGADAVAVLTALFGARDVRSAARAFSELFQFPFDRVQ
jgi:thiamine-phosphate pyrophosphorylase